MPIYHVKSNTIADGTNTDLVRPSDWNSAHAYTLQDAVSITGNTAGTLANISSGTFYLAGGSNVTLSQNGNTVSVVVGGGTNTNQTGGVYADSNSFGTSSGTYDLRSLSIEGSGGVSVAASNGGFVVSGVQPILSEFDPYSYPNLSMTPLGHSLGTLYLQPFDLPQYLSANHFNLFVTAVTVFSGTRATSDSASGGWTVSVALYTRGSSDSTDRIMLHWSNYAYVSIQRVRSVSSQFTLTHCAGLSNSTAVSYITTTVNATDASTYIDNYLGGFRIIQYPISSIMTPGRYWFGLIYTRNSAFADLCTQNVEFLAITNNFSQISAYAPFCANSVSSNNGFPLMHPGFGSYTTSTLSMPSSIALTNGDISAKSGGTMTKHYFNFSGYTTGTILG